MVTAFEINVNSKDQLLSIFVYFPNKNIFGWEKKSKMDSKLVFLSFSTLKYPNGMILESIGNLFGIFVKNLHNSCVFFYDSNI